MNPLKSFNRFASALLVVAIVGLFAWGTAFAADQRIQQLIDEGVLDSSYSDAVVKPGIETFTMPAGDSVTLKLYFLKEKASYENEFGFFSITQNTPDPSNERRAFINYAMKNATVVFHGNGPLNDEPTMQAEFQVSGGSKLAFFIVKNDTVEHYLEEAGFLYRTYPNYPDVWFSIEDANTDHFDHLKAYYSANNDRYVFCFEDLLNGGDKDYNDVIFSLQAAADVPPQTVDDLVLETVCSDDPATERKWRVFNPNDFAVDVNWSIYSENSDKRSGGHGSGGSSEQTGSFTAAAGENFFVSDTVNDDNWATISWMNEKNETKTVSKKSGGEDCTPPVPVEDLVLASVCSDDPDLQRRWTVNNPNEFNVDVTWELKNSDQEGSFTALPGENEFYTNTIDGDNKVEIKWKDEKNHNQKESLESIGEDCTPPEPVADIVLEAVCSDDPDTQRNWKITNPNDFPVEIIWSMYDPNGKGNQGIGNGFDPAAPGIENNQNEFQKWRDDIQNTPSANKKGKNQGNVITLTPGVNTLTTDTVEGSNTVIIVWQNENGTYKNVYVESPGERCGEADGPILKYIYERCTGDKVYDWSLFGENCYCGAGPNLGTMFGGEWMEGFNGHGLFFDGEAYVLTNDSDQLDLSTQGTLMTWVKFDSTTGDQPIIHKGASSGTADDAYTLMLDNGKLALKLIGCYEETVDKRVVTPTCAETETLLKANDNIPANEWVFVAATWNANGMKLFINGEPVASNNIAVTAEKTDGALILGGTSESETPFIGVLDDTRIYAYALMESEVKAIFDAAEYKPYDCVPCSAPDGLAVSFYDEQCANITGVWLYEYTGRWCRISEDNAEFLASYDSKLGGDFGALGMFEYVGLDIKKLWKNLTGVNADNTGVTMLPYKNGFVGDFGDNVGLYYNENMHFSFMTLSNPETIAVFGPNKEYVAGDFGDLGLYYYDGDRWHGLTSYNPDNDGNAIIGYKDGLVVDFGDSGLWYYEINAGWKHLTDSNAQFMAVNGDNLYVDFGSGLGLYEYNGASWKNLTDFDPDDTGVALLAYSGGIAVDFGSYGLWYYKDTHWKNLTDDDPEYMVSMGSRLAADFGDLGLYEYNGTSWKHLSQENPENGVLTYIPDTSN